MVGGRNATEGRLEFCYGGMWGTVCRDQWGALDARVACRQLGFSTAGIKRNEHSPIAKLYIALRKHDIVHVHYTHRC